MGLFLVILLLFISCIAFAISSNNKNKEISLNNREYISKELEKQGFNATKTINVTIYDEILIDENSKNIAICHYLSSGYRVIPFSNITDVSIYEDGEERRSFGIGRAIVGGILAGGVGAIVGATTAKSKKVVNSYELRIFTRSINEPIHRIICSSEFVATNSFATISAIIG